MEGVEGPAGSRSPSPTPYLPHLDRLKLEGDEVLVADQSTYQMLHSLRLQWPALSFDVLRDDLGEERRKFPHSACVVAGTQAAHGHVDADEIYVMRWESLTRTQREEAGSDDDSDDEPLGETRGYGKVVFQDRTFAKFGGRSWTYAFLLSRSPLAGAKSPTRMIMGMKVTWGEEGHGGWIPS